MPVPRIPTLDRMRASLPKPSRRTLVAVALVLILGLAALLRILHTRSGLPYLHHWDEPQIASTALHMMKTGDYNPHFFHYGSLSIYANLFVDILHYFYLLREEPIPFSVIIGPMDQRAINLDDIQTRFDTGWHWGVSHPSFYLWNRWLTAAFGTATVLVAYLVTRAVAGSAAGLIAAAFLAAQGFHVAQSSIVTVDVPMAFFVVLVVFSTLLFDQRSRPRYLVLALLLCGLAASTKYNAVVGLITPLAALALASRESIPALSWLWLAVPTLPALSFLVTTPYVVLDLPEFLSQAGYELYHYAARGHGAVSTEPGWAHLTLQLNRLGSSLGVVASVIVLAGLVVLIRRRSGFLTLLFPLVYLIYMAGTRVSFHRNLVVLYPFIAIALGVGVLTLGRQLGRLEKRVEKRVPWRKGYAVGLLSLLLAAWYAQLVFTGFVDGWRDWNHRETRSQAIDTINSLADSISTEGDGGGIRVGIAEELRIHSLDLDRLETAVTVGPHLSLVCHAAEYDILVTGQHYFGLWGDNKQAKEKALLLNAARLQDVEHIVVGVAQGAAASPTLLDGLSENPTVLIHLPRRQGRRLPPVCDEEGGPEPSRNA
ncbi:MAG: phospholipid carrier-dependent glycosyltransferase [bacterium]|nr:phospholipid carrier-dependent glycosyltransferase [bacterium]